MHLNQVRRDQLQDRRQKETLKKGSRIHSIGKAGKEYMTGPRQGLDGNLRYRHLKLIQDPENLIA